MRILVTGSAGFIGSATVLRLLEDGHEVLGIDNHNDYYDPALKEVRLARHADHPAYTHVRADIADKNRVEEIFSSFRPEWVVHLAAQAGVRYSLEAPLSYIETNLVGFAHILEGCRHTGVKHLLYASSSSVYGGNSKTPYSATDNVDHPLSLYAATKKSNELMAHAYSHLYDIPATGLRFFTVYGPYDRPDMALQKFAVRMLAGEKLDVYNKGEHRRDWTFIDDIVEGVMRLLPLPPAAGEVAAGDELSPDRSTAPWRTFNIGRGKPVPLLDVIAKLEEALGVKARMNFLPLQPGDVVETHADIETLKSLTGYEPQVSIDEGILAFTKWFQEYGCSNS